MTLDQRARQAAEGVRSSVDGHPLLLMSPAPAGRQLMPTVLSFASAFAAVVIVGFLMMQTSMFASDDDTTETTVAPSTTTTSTTVPVSTTIPAAVVPEPSETTIPAVGVQPEIDTTAPLIEITVPQNEERFSEKKIVFAGVTEPGAVVMAGPYAATVKDDGSWSIVLILDEGGNRATITATDAAGNVGEATVVVYYDPPVTTTKPPSSWEFTAYAKYGECELNPPYDEYYGTAAPGTKILVTSEFGSGSTVANASGEWWVKVEFPSAPYGKVFSVRVKNETTFEKYFFEFVSLAK